MSSGDDTFFQNGLHNWSDETQFYDKQWIWQQDQNSGVYSNSQVNFSLDGLSNNPGYINWSEGYIVVPIVASVDNVASDTDFALAFKNGFYQLVNSVSIKIGNLDVNNKCDFTNLHINWKLLSSFSYDDLINNGSTLGIYPDNALSGRYLASNLRNNSLKLQSFPGVAQQALAVNNNSVTVPAIDTYTNLYNTAGSYAPVRFNDGLYKRALYSAFSPGAGLTDLVDLSIVQSTLRNYSEFDTNVQYYYIQAVIRLKDLHPVFEAMDMPIAGANVKLTLNLNTGKVELTTPKTTGTNDDTVISSVNVNGQTFPMMATDSLLVNNTTNADVKRTITVSIASVSAGKSNYLNACRVYVPLYQMNPEYQTKYLAAGNVKKIKYNDLYQFTVPNVGGPNGKSINAILTNGISGMKRLVIVPILNASANGVQATGFYSPLLSPLTTDGGTPSAQVVLQNFNLQISGKNIYQQNLDYDFEQYMWEVRSALNTNGGLTDGLSAGLIGQLEWANNYRYYVVDLSRRVSADDTVAKSLTLMCKLVSKKACDLVCFVEYEKELQIDVTDGKVVIV